MIQRQSYSFRFDESGFSMFAAPGAQALLVCRGVPYLPVTNLAITWGPPTVQRERRGNDSLVQYRFVDNHVYDAPTVSLLLKDDHVAMSFSAVARKPHYINRWHLLPGGSNIQAMEVSEFKSHLNSYRPYDTQHVVLGRRKLGVVGIDVNTEDGDLMFAPHPMMFVLHYLDHAMVIGAMGLVHGESCALRMRKGSDVVEEFAIACGDYVCRVEAGQRVESTPFMLLPLEPVNPTDACARYSGVLVREGLVKPKREQDMEPWWLGPIYCTWGDQHVMTATGEIVRTASSNAGRLATTNAVTEKLVSKVVSVIEEHDLPIRTLILDDRWYTWQGDMHADPAKFPDMRGLVDSLHDRGFKVLCWASLYQFERGSRVFREHPEWFIVHHYPRNLRANPERDIIHLNYADPVIARAYLDELLTRLLSDSPGCYNFDGIKFDWPFLMPHNYPFDDPAWQGKEMVMYRTQKLIYSTAKRVKPDCLIIGVSPHPFFLDTQDIIRTYDASTYDVRVHLDRGRYVKAICPGMVPALDEYPFYRNFFRYVRESGELGIPMIYNLLMFNADEHAYTPQDYETLRSILDEYVASRPALGEHFASLKATKVASRRRVASVR